MTADALAAFYKSIGMPVRIRELDIPETDLPLLAQDTRKNFNAQSGVRSDDDIDKMRQLLQAVW